MDGAEQDTKRKTPDMESTCHSHQVQKQTKLNEVLKVSTDCGEEVVIGRQQGCRLCSTSSPGWCLKGCRLVKIQRALNLGYVHFPCTFCPSVKVYFEY